MSPNVHTKQIVVLALPTLVILFSYLWYKKRKLANSSPATSSTNQPEIYTAESKDEVDEVVKKDHKTNRKTLTGVSTSPIDIKIAMKTPNYVIPDSQLDIELQKIKSVKSGGIVTREDDKSPTMQAITPKIGCSNTSATTPSTPIATPSLPSNRGSVKKVRSALSLELEKLKTSPNNLPATSPQEITAVIAPVVEHFHIQAVQNSPENLKENMASPEDVATSTTTDVTVPSECESSKNEMTECDDVTNMDKNSQVHPVDNHCVTSSASRTSSASVSSANDEQPDDDDDEEKMYEGQGARPKLTKQERRMAKKEKKKLKATAKIEQVIYISGNEMGKKRRNSKKDSRQRYNRAASLVEMDRDSANHSPLELRLGASPTSCGCQADDESSSDSGKGCSDVITPAGDGSLKDHGDDARSHKSIDSNTIVSYTFLIPPVYIGRFIGKDGSFVKSILQKTHVRATVDPQQVSSEPKLCRLTGTQRQIVKALKMIREKFPKKTCADFTLEKYVPIIQLQPEYLTVQLYDGILNDTIVSCVVSPVQLFIVQHLHPTYPLVLEQGELMTMAYNSGPAPLLPKDMIQSGIICAAPFQNKWHRAMVMSTETDDLSEVFLVDIGYSTTFENKYLRQINSQFMDLPFQANVCILANLALKPDITPEQLADGVKFILSQTNMRQVSTKVIDYSDENIPIVFIFIQGDNESIFLNEIIARHGYADMVYDYQFSAPHRRIAPTIIHNQQMNVNHFDDIVEDVETSCPNIQQPVC